MQNKIK